MLQVFVELQVLVWLVELRLRPPFAPLVATCLGTPIGGSGTGEFTLAAAAAAAELASQLALAFGTDAGAIHCATLLEDDEKGDSSGVSERGSGGMCLRFVVSVSEPGQEAALRRRMSEVETAIQAESCVGKNCALHISDDSAEVVDYLCPFRHGSGGEIEEGMIGQHWEDVDSEAYKEKWAFWGRIVAGIETLWAALGSSAATGLGSENVDATAPMAAAKMADVGGGSGGYGSPIPWLGLDADGAGDGDSGGEESPRRLMLASAAAMGSSSPGKPLNSESQQQHQRWGSRRRWQRRPHHRHRDEHWAMFLDGASALALPSYRPSVPELMRMHRPSSPLPQATLLTLPWPTRPAALSPRPRTGLVHPGLRWGRGGVASPRAGGRPRSLLQRARMAVRGMASEFAAMIENMCIGWLQQSWLQQLLSGGADIRGTQYAGMAPADSDEKWCVRVWDASGRRSVRASALQRMLAELPADALDHLPPASAPTPPQPGAFKSSEPTHLR